MSQQQIKSILKIYHTVAIVGLSNDTSKPSNKVARYLQSVGYRVIPVNPFIDHILGEKAYETLLDVPDLIEIVDIFRPSDEVFSVVEQAITLRKKFGYPHVIWMQEGVINERAAQQAEQAGFTVIMDHCLKKEHQRHKQSLKRQ